MVIRGQHATTPFCSQDHYGYYYNTGCQDHYGVTLCNNP